VSLMSSSIKSLMIGLALAGTLASTGCGATMYAGRSRVYVRTGPPPIVVERRSVAPGPGYVWVDGYYRWDGRAYVWSNGRYERPPHPRARWEAGHWQRDRHGWYFVEGHWR